MDEVFGNSSGETVIESPLSLSVIEEEQNLSDLDDPKNLNDNCSSIQKSVDELNSKNTIKGVNFRDNKNGCNFFDGGNVRTQSLNEYERIELISKLKNKLLDLNDTLEVPIEQNSENHQLEETRISHENLSKEKCRVERGYVNDISKTVDDSSVKINSSIEDYLDRMSKLENFQRLVDKVSANNISKKTNKFTSVRSPRLFRSQFTTSPHLQRTLASQKNLSPPVRRLMPQENDIGKFSPRPRSMTTASVAARHLYQNLPSPALTRLNLANRNCKGSPSAKGAPMPVYVNVPEPRSSPKLQTSLRHSYVELWGTGDADCSMAVKPIRPSSVSSTLSSPASPPRNKQSPVYVEMSSPFVRSPVSTVYAQLSNSIASYAGQAPQTLFCPLCPRQFNFQRALAGHIQKNHRLELEAMVDGQPGDVNLYCCPVCRARFFNSSVLPKHLMDCHKGSLISILEKCRCIQIRSNEMQCPFCVKCVPVGVNGEHIFLFHLQQYHSSQYEDMISSVFRVNSSEMNNISGSPAATLGPGIHSTSTPGLSNQLGSMLVSSESKRKLDDLEEDSCITGIHPLKTPKNYEKQEPRRSVSKGILRREKKANERPHVKRELRFSVPHVTKEEIYFPESPGPITPDPTERLDLNTFSFPANRYSLNQQSSNVLQGDLDAITNEDFVDLNQQGSRKRRKLCLSIRSKNIFRCKDKENQEARPDVNEQQIYMTMGSRSYRREPKPVAPPTAPATKTGGSPCAAKIHSTALTVSNHDTFEETGDSSNASKKSGCNPSSIEYSNSRNESNLRVTRSAGSLGEVTKDADSERANSLLDPAFSSSVKLYSPLRIFRCNCCRNKFCDNDSLLAHISQNHRGFLSLLRPQFGCGVCSAKFYENKQLVKHCLQHHISLLEIRSVSGEIIPSVSFTRADSTKSKFRSSLRESKQPVTAL